MPRFMIELPFAIDTCLKSIPKIGERESDFLPQVFWGCTVGGQEGWAIVEAESIDQVANTIPEALREHVWITEVKTLTLELIEALRNHEIENAA